MSIDKFHAPLTFTCNNGVLKDAVVVVDDKGIILSIDNIIDHDVTSVKRIENAIVPGFVNCHCHLELSHMKGFVETGTTLLPFIKNVVKHRAFSQQIIDDAINKADNEMYENGIVAVGDICNKIDGAACKSKSKLHYYSFVEMFDFLNGDFTLQTIDQYTPVFDQHEEGDRNRKSFVPHAPYSVSRPLFDFINQKNKSNAIVSIHNQETVAEDLLFKSKTGPFIDFYAEFGNNLNQFNATGKSSIHYAIQNMDAKLKTLFVHNTCTTKEDIIAAQNWNSKIYWVTCPNANLYIENMLPDYKTFVELDQKMAIGTDSLTSNWQLSIFEEIKTIFKYCSYLPLPKILDWACKNGAEALGFDHLGKIEVGKQPGLVSCPIIEKEGKYLISEGKPHRL